MSQALLTDRSRFICLSSGSKGVFSMRPQQNDSAGGAFFTRRMGGLDFRRTLYPESFVSLLVLYKGGYDGAS